MRGVKFGVKTIAVPPAETIREFLDSRNMTQKELAVRMGMTEKTVSLLMHGQAPLTPEIATKLELVFGPSADFWLKLENFYRLDLAKAISELQ